MYRFRTLLVLALVLALPAVLTAAPRGVGKRGGTRGDQAHLVRGVVVEVHKDADRDNGSFTIRVHGRGKGKGKAGAGAGAGAGGDRRTFQVLPVTRFVKVQNGQRQPASFRDLDQGDRVAVRPMDDRPAIAQVVTILGGKKDNSSVVRGVVLEGQKDPDRDNGSFTLRVRHKGKSAAGTGDDRRTFQVLPVTQFERVHEGQHERVSFKALHEGQRVEVHPLDDRPTFARLVEILADPR
jgi:hypothetical protein